MKTEKEPLTLKQLTRMENTARTYDDASILKIFQLLRYTGMHPSVLVDPKYDLHETTNDNGKAIIVWKRPKKKGKDAHTSIKKASAINFDINDFVKRYQRRKRKRSRQYIHSVIMKIGEDTGIPGTSPMTLRHSACVDLLNRGIPEVVVMQIMNVSKKTMGHYAKYTDAGKADILEKVDW